MFRRYALLLPMAVSAACAGGSTMRVAGDDSADEGPVALAPAPQAESDSGAFVAESTSMQAPASQLDTTARGYAPYGTSAALDMRRIGQWTHTGIAEARRLVIRDANTWTDFWSELGVGERRTVDFSREVVIAVAAGQRPTGGHEITVSRVSQTEGELRIEVVETAPAPDCSPGTALTQPVDVIVVPGLTPRSWSFVERKEVRACH